jgi:hypothetical protein
MRQEKEGAAAKTALTEEVRAALAKLEERYRLPVVLRYENGLSQAEVAAVLEIPPGTAGSLISRGIEKLREKLGAHGRQAESAAVIGALGAGVELEAPAALVAKIGGIINSGDSPAAGTIGAAKGGIAMKVLLGVVLAGDLAGGAALFFGPTTGNRQPATTLASPPAPSGPPKCEHFASVNAYGELDGPAKEAGDFGTQRYSVGFPDAEGNLWGSGGKRWLRASDNRVLRLSAYEYGTMGFDLKEGPVVGRPVTYEAGDYGWWCGGSAMVGRPDAGGKTDGIYESLGRQGQMIRIWKNKEKGGRWWFARAAGGGDAAAPKTKGQSADALAVKFGWINEPQIGLDNKFRFMADNAFYLFEDGKVTCVLSPDDYKPATDVMKGLPNQGYVGGDGTFYLGYYFSGKGAYEGTAPAIWRVTTDGKVEPCAKNNGGQGVDGDALTQGGWFCGPHLSQYSVARFIPPDAVLTTAHDEDVIRRLQKGRVATLCVDGEWRELNHSGKPNMDLCTPVIGPNGTVYFCYRRWINQRSYRYTGVDFNKPAINKREGGGK